MQTKLARDYFRLMHFPLPLCVLSFATLGALIAPSLILDRLAWTYLIVFASLCLASYSFDELESRPLHTTIPENQLRIVGWSGLLLSLATGFYLALSINLSLLAWIPPSVLVILGYNRELFSGRLHNGPVFAVGWGGIPTLGSYYLQTTSLSITALATAAATIVFSFAIWTLNHEFRFELETLRSMSGEGLDRTIDRSARRSIWKITQILCYSLTLFTLAFGVYRFFP